MAHTAGCNGAGRLCRYCGHDLTVNEQAVKMRYCQGDLERAFKWVQNSEDWKAEIDAYISLDRRDIPLLKNAVAHFTATRATVKILDRRLGEASVYRVTAKGYRAGPAGDR